MTNKKNIQDELSSLESVKEIVKTGNIYPNLYSQMSYAISDLQKEESKAYWMRSKNFMEFKEILLYLKY